MMLKLALTSDTHGRLNFSEVPGCDVLVHAGDICTDGYKGIWCRKDLGRSALWMREQFLPHIQNLLDEGIIKYFVATWGNHDWCSRTEAKVLSTDKIHILVDDFIDIAGVRFWGSPWSNQFMNWAWMKEAEDLKPIYVAIPHVDVLISHQPPIGFGSMYYDILSGKTEDIGSYELAQELERIHPQLVVCGHIHSGAGQYDHPLGFKIINAAYVDEQYRPANKPVIVYVE